MIYHSLSVYNNKIPVSGGILSFEGVVSEKLVLGEQYIEAIYSVLPST